MTPEPNRSVKFRAALKREIPILMANGILTAEAKDRLTTIYKLDRLGKESSRLLTAVLFIFGSLLVGGGIISFVAAHWAEIPRGLQVGLLFGTLTALYLAGYQLKYRTDQTRLGHALIFCACLVFGANIGLLAQIYHVNGDWYGMFGVWALGSIAMAWVAESWIIGLLVLVTSFTWFAGLTGDHHERLATLYPLLLAGAVLPLAWRTRSRTLYLLTFLGFIVAEVMLAAAQTRTGYYPLIAMTAAGLAAWVVGEFHQTSGIRPELGTPVANLGLAALIVGAYIWSFHGIWPGNLYSSTNQFYWAIPAGAALAIGAALIVRIWPRMSAQQKLYLGSAVLVFASSCLAALLNTSSPALPASVMNLAALTVAGLCIGKGLVDESRPTFWAGSLTIVALIVSRFFEYETSLLLKSAVFITCGIGAIFAGVTYERLLRRKEVFAR